MVKIIVSAAMGNPLKTFFDGYSDDKIKSCTYKDKKGIQMFFDVETEMAPDQCANYMKSLFKKQPGASAMFFSIQPDGFFG